MNKIKALIKKYLNYETISYLIVGVLTTLLNIFVFWVCKPYMHLQIANAIAWIIAVIFAFYANKYVVFKDPAKGAKNMLIQLLLFGYYRLLTLGIEALLLWILVDKLSFNDLYSKVFTNIVVVILNYIAMKFFLFNKKKAGSEELANETEANN